MKSLKISLILIFASITCFAQSYREPPRTGYFFGDAQILGIEFWLYRDDQPPPSEGKFTMEFSKKSARKCMHDSYDLLKSWLNEPEHPLAKLVTERKSLGGDIKFFLWVNDYEKGQSFLNRQRTSKVWWWSSDGSYKKGLFKFESSALPDGSCIMPKEEQVISYFEEQNAILSGTSSGRTINQSSRGENIVESEPNTPSTHVDLGAER